MKREKAIAVGNRAGVVEWANAAWSRVTGYALEDAVAKPVADLLGTAGIDRDVIDLVKRRFERGETCEIELPLDPPGAGRRWIHVSVESLRDRYGEVSHFAAIAWDITDEKKRPAPVPAVAPLRAPGGVLVADLEIAPTDLSSLVREVASRCAGDGAGRTVLDLDVPERLPRVAVDRARIEQTLAGLLDEAVRAIGSEWGTVSVSTGLARNEALFVSPSYPRNCLLRGLDHDLYAYVEVHDTGPPVDPTVVELLAEHAPWADADRALGGRVAGLAAARSLLRAHGGELRLDADPGFGTRAILLFPC
jgi:PAS domain S-box-containing protein